MKRKLVKHGESTLTVSLPSKWIKNHSLKNGDYLNLDISDQGLILSPESTHYDKIEINFEKRDNWYIEKILTNLYISGFDEIRVKFGSAEQLESVRRCLIELTGFEIVETKKDYCIIKNIASIDSVNYEETIERVFWMILSQFDNFIEDLKKEKLSNYAISTNDHRTIIKQINLSRRLINKKISFGLITSKYVFNFLTSLLNISRIIHYSYEYLKRTDSLNLSEEEMNFILKMREFYYLLILAYKNLNLEKTKTFLEEREKISDDSLEMLRKKNPIIMHFFLDVLKELSGVSNLIFMLTIKNTE